MVTPPGPALLVYFPGKVAYATTSDLVSFGLFVAFGLATSILLILSVFFPDGRNTASRWARRKAAAVFGASGTILVLAGIALLFDGYWRQPGQVDGCLYTWCDAPPGVNGFTEYWVGFLLVIFGISTCLAGLVIMITSHPPAPKGHE